MSSNYQQKKMMNALDERGRVFDRPCQVLDDGDLDEH